MASTISISVVIPAHNRAKTIGYCLDSVCNQTAKPLEVIVVDDCSTDNTVQVVNDYSRLHPLVKVVELAHNSGAQAARNRGIVEAKGEWIAFQDSDDEWTLDKLEKQISALAKTGYDPLTVVHTDAWRHNPVSGERKIWNVQLCEGWVHADLLRAPAPLFPAMLTSKSSLIQIGLLDEAVPSYQEWDTAIRLAKKCRFIHIREPLFVYHIHAGETISKDNMKNIKGYQYILDKHREDIIRVCDIETLNRHLEENALKAMRMGFYTEAQQIMKKTIGTSFHIALIKCIARRIISIHIYTFVTRVVRRIWLIGEDMSIKNNIRVK
ncbi:MAG: glycosyltransferase family 2 protein [Gammaproteobacteria bacterium]|nr:glycosyltransferase family 2 protein [Gammaproteobacteria bacterium]